MDGETPDSSKKEENVENRSQDQPSSSNISSDQERPSKVARRNYRRRTESSSSDEMEIDVESRQQVTTSTPESNPQDPVVAEEVNRDDEPIEDVSEDPENANQDR